MDTTYFGRQFGLMIFIDNSSKAVLHYLIVSHETNLAYRQGIEYIKSQGTKIASITCDGRRGLKDIFAPIPVQMCQFHQLQIVTRYLTRRPKNIASITLRKLALTLTTTSKDRFTTQLDDWYITHEDYLNERSINTETGKSWYTHKRLRSAYRSLRTNLDWLFTYEDYPHLDIPNTTNLLEGLFGELKRQLHCHHGLSNERKLRFIKDFIESRWHQ